VEVKETGDTLDLKELVVLKVSLDYLEVQQDGRVIQETLVTQEIQVRPVRMDILEEMVRQVLPVRMDILEEMVRQE
jgi:hypothetical protein